MLCPVCGDPLAEKTISTGGGGRLQLNTCETCGGIWCEHGVANRLTPKQAETISGHLKKSAGISAIDPICNRCGEQMKKVKVESVPPDVVVYTCPSCQANWFPTGQLPKLRRAQWYKLEYLKAFNIPFASFSTVLLPVLLIALLGAGALYTSQRLRQPTRVPSQAAETIKELRVTPTGDRSVKISFFTPTPAKSYLKFVINNKPGRLTISPNHRRYHQIQVSDISGNDRFQISLEPLGGVPFSTASQPFLPNQ